MSDLIVINEQGTASPEPIVEEDADLREWRERGLELAKEDAAYQQGIAQRNFAIGDWLSDGEETYSRHAYQDAVEIFPHYTIEILRNFVYVARSIETSVRSDVLSWKHHTVVAPYESALQKKYLDQAADEDLAMPGFKVQGRLMSASKLRQLIQEENPKPHAMPPMTVLLTFQWSGVKQSRELPECIGKDFLNLTEAYSGRNGAVKDPAGPRLKDPVDVLVWLVTRALTEIPDVAKAVDDLRRIHEHARLLEARGSGIGQPDEGEFEPEPEPEQQFEPEFEPEPNWPAAEDQA